MFDLTLYFKDDTVGYVTIETYPLDVTEGGGHGYEVTEHTGFDIDEYYEEMDNLICGWLYDNQNAKCEEDIRSYSCG